MKHGSSSSTSSAHINNNRASSQELLNTLLLGETSDDAFSRKLRDALDRKRERHFQRISRRGSHQSNAISRKSRGASSSSWSSASGSKKNQNYLPGASSSSKGKKDHSSSSTSSSSATILNTHQTSILSFQRHSAPRYKWDTPATVAKSSRADTPKQLTLDQIMRRAATKKRTKPRSMQPPRNGSSSTSTNLHSSSSPTTQEKDPDTHHRDKSIHHTSAKSGVGVKRKRFIIATKSKSLSSSSATEACDAASVGATDTHRNNQQKRRKLSQCNSTGSSSRSFRHTPPMGIVQSPSPLLDSFCSSEDEDLFSSSEDEAEIQMSRSSSLLSEDANYYTATEDDEEEDEDESLHPQSSVGSQLF